MQVSIESTGGLDRRMTVRLPTAGLTEELDKRLRTLSRQVRLQGFRPGKVPLKIVQQRYGAGLYRELLEEKIKQGLLDAMAQEGLSPAAPPTIEPLSAQDLDAAQQSATLGFVATFQVMPEVRLADFTGLVIRQPEVEITDADIDQVVASLRRQRRSWQGVERAVQEGDRITLNFAGSLDGVAISEAAAQGYTLEVGAQQFIPDFERQLPGLVVGPETLLDVHFPEDYAQESLRGKTVQFAVQITRVEAPEDPPVDAEFIRQFGVDSGDLAEFHSEIRGNMTRQLATKIREQVRGQVLEAMVTYHPLDLPAAWVQQETMHMRKTLLEQLRSSGTTAPPELQDEWFLPEAKRRVHLGVVMQEILRSQGIRLDAERVTRFLEEMAESYEEPQQWIQHYRAQPERMQAIERFILEEQLVDWVLGQAQIQPEPSSFASVMNPNTAPENAR